MGAARYLLSLDADPNRAHTAGGLNTPLHEAVAGSSLPATRLLLKSSANVLAANARGDLPLHVACRVGRLDIARRLLAHDADWLTTSARNHAGKKPVDLARPCTTLASLLRFVEKDTALSAGKRRPCPSRVRRKGSTSGGSTGDTRRKHNERFTSKFGRRWRRGGLDGVGGTEDDRRRRAGAGSRAQTEGAWGSSDGRRPMPKWVRLPRPLRDAAEEGGGPVPLESASVTGSGTSCAASLTESDFEIPVQAVPAGHAAKGAQIGTRFK